LFIGLLSIYRYLALELDENSISHEKEYFMSPLNFHWRLIHLPGVFLEMRKGGKKRKKFFVVQICKLEINL